MVINVKAIKRGSCKRAAAGGWRLLIGGVICAAVGIRALSGWVIGGWVVRSGGRETDTDVLSLQKKMRLAKLGWLCERREREWQEVSKSDRMTPRESWQIRQSERTVSKRMGQNRLFSCSHSKWYTIRKAQSATITGWLTRGNGAFSLSLSLSVWMSQSCPRSGA